MAPGPTGGRPTVRDRRAYGVAATCVAVAILAVRRFRIGVGVLVAWNLATLAWLTLSWQFARRSSPARTREWAQSRSRRTSRRDRTVAVAFSLFGVVFALGLLTLSRRPTSAVAHVEIALSGLAVVFAWLVLNVEYAAYYAALYYGDESEGGLSFPGGGDPAQFDFVYFAFTLGTAISTSDVTIASRELRTTALGHVLLAFGYNTGILGAVVNVANLYA